MIFAKNIKEQKDYYPFGKEHENPNLITSTNRWGFSGKEKQTVKNLGFLDFGARMLETEIGRWFVIDPLTEKYYSISPYAYCLNNPVNVIDPDGKFAFVIPFIPAIIKAAVTVVTAVTAAVVVKHAYDKHREQRREQERRDRRSADEDANISRKHRDMVDNNVGKPSPDGTPDPKGSPKNIVEKIAIGVGTTAVTIQMIDEVTQGDNNGNSEKMPGLISSDKQADEQGESSESQSQSESKPKTVLEDTKIEVPVYNPFPQVLPFK
jgi:RHS repeat-associated protein